jgi:hypothetical protein
MGVFPWLALADYGWQQEGDMQFAILYRWRGNATGPETRTVRSLFMAWEPPTGVELISHYYFARGGGIVIVDVGAVSALFEALSPFTPTVEFDIEPVFNPIEAIAISMDVDEWANAVMSHPRELDT